MYLDNIEKTITQSLTEISYRFTNPHYIKQTQFTTKSQSKHISKWIANNHLSDIF